MFTHTIQNQQASIGTKVFYGNLIVMLLNIIVFSLLYISFFESPSVEEYKYLSREGVKIYFGVIPVVTYSLYKAFKKKESDFEH